MENEKTPKNILGDISSHKKPFREVK